MPGPLGVGLPLVSWPEQDDCREGELGSRLSRVATRHQSLSLPDSLSIRLWHLSNFTGAIAELAGSREASDRAPLHSLGLDALRRAFKQVASSRIALGSAVLVAGPSMILCFGVQN